QPFVTAVRPMQSSLKVASECPTSLAASYSDNALVMAGETPKARSHSRATLTRRDRSESPATVSTSSVVSILEVSWPLYHTSNKIRHKNGFNPYLGVDECRNGRRRCERAVATIRISLQSSTF